MTWNYNSAVQILINTAGCLGACAQLEEARTAIRNASGIRPLVHLLTETNTVRMTSLSHQPRECCLWNWCFSCCWERGAVKLRFKLPLQIV